MKNSDHDCVTKQRHAEEGPAAASCAQFVRLERFCVCAAENRTHAVSSHCVSKDVCVDTDVLKMKKNLLKHTLVLFSCIPNASLGCEAN